MEVIETTATQSSTLQFSEASRARKYRKRAHLFSVLSELKMNVEDLLEMSLTAILNDTSEIASISDDIRKKLNQLTRALESELNLTPTQSDALLMYRGYIERDLSFFRRHFGGIPSDGSRQCFSFLQRCTRY